MSSNSQSISPATSSAAAQPRPPPLAAAAGESGAAEAAPPLLAARRLSFSLSTQLSLPNHVSPNPAASSDFSPLQKCDDHDLNAAAAAAAAGEVAAGAVAAAGVCQVADHNNNSNNNGNPQTTAAEGASPFEFLPPSAAAAAADGGPLQKQQRGESRVLLNNFFQTWDRLLVLLWRLFTLKARYPLFTLIGSLGPSKTNIIIPILCFLFVFYILNKKLITAKGAITTVFIYILIYSFVYLFSC